MAQIFLCHASEDKAQVREVYHRLKALGFEPWLDEEDLLPGQDWTREIPRALQDSDFILVFLSRASVAKRGYVQREMRLALDVLQELPEGVIHSIPVRLDDCDVPEPFRRYHYANLFDPRGFDRLTRAINTGLTQRQHFAPQSTLEPPLEPVPDRDHTFTNSIGMEFILIPAGTFIMGSPDSDAEADEDEKPANRVTISQPFYLGKYPITQAQWEAVMGTNPSRCQGNSNHPVECVSWDDVQAFMRKLNEREEGGAYCLPTEAQWEYACRAGTMTPRYHQDMDAIAWYKANSSRQTHPVGQKLPNAWGLYDMLGNLWEWVQDRYAKDYYRPSPTVDPQGPDAGADRVVRGGSWNCGALDVRAAGRGGVSPGRRRDVLGFRCSSFGPSR